MLEIVWVSMVSGCLSYAGTVRGGCKIKPGRGHGSIRAERARCPKRGALGRQKEQNTHCAWEDSDFFRATGVGAGGPSAVH